MPRLRLDVLAPEWVAPVVRRMPEVRRGDRGALSPRRARSWARAGASAASCARAATTRRSCCRTPGSRRWCPSLRDIPLRSGYVGESRYGLLNQLYQQERARADARSTTRACPRRRASRREPLPAPQLDAPSDRDLAGYASNSASPGRYAVLCPGAEYGPAKRWPYFAELRRAARRARSVVLGSASDAEAARGIAGHQPGRQDQLDEAIDLIAGAALRGDATIPA